MKERQRRPLRSEEDRVKSFEEILGPSEQQSTSVNIPGSNNDKNQTRLLENILVLLHHRLENIFLTEPRRENGDLEI